MKMFSIACTVTKKSVTTSTSSPPSSPIAKNSPVSVSSSTTVTKTEIPSSNFPQRRRSTFRKMFMTLTIVSSLAVLLGTITFTQALATPYDSAAYASRFKPCTDEVNSRLQHAAWLDREYGASPTHRAHHLPQCMSTGLYNATQCRQELDLCWCVGQRSGRVLSHVFHPGSAGEIRCADDDDDDESDNRQNDKNNSADADSEENMNNNNNSTLLQNNNGTSNGNETMSSNNNGTASTDQQQQQPEEQEERRRRRPSRRPRAGPCTWAKRRLAAHEEETGRRLLGSFTPECTDDGLFELTQCHASSGFCWCADKYTGERVSPAFRQWSRGLDCEGEEFLINASFKPY